MLSIIETRPAPVPPQADQVSVPMRDGVLLAADLYLADPPEPGAVVLVRLPYDKDGSYCFMPVISEYFRARGYHVLVQDVRGKYRSGGDPEFAVNEVDDGYDTVQWVTEQRWCDGNVVMWGDSYYGYTTIAAAISGHPALKAIAPRLTGSQLSITLDNGDGTTEVEQTSRKVYFASHYVDANRYEWTPDWSTRPLRAAFEPFFEQVGKRSANFDAEFGGRSRFIPPPLTALLKSPPVPALYTIGWFDNCAVWSWNDVRALAKHPEWSEHLHLRLEAIDHENYRLCQAPITPPDDHTENPAAMQVLLPRYLDPALEFFDSVLGRSGAMPPRVRYEVCHGDWHAGSSWPPVETRSVEYRLAPGALTTAATAEETRLTWTHNPSDLVPSPGANPFTSLFDYADLARVAERDDVLRFLGEAVHCDLDLVGTANLALRLTAPAGANIHVRLLDVTPDGRAHLITYGQAHLKKAAQDNCVLVDLRSIAYRLRNGHSLALDLMSSDFPDFVPEAGDADDPWSTLPGEPAVRAVSVGGASASCLRIGAWDIDDLRQRSEGSAF